MNSVKLALKSRALALNLVARAKSSHIGSALSIIDILSVLYSGVLKINSKTSNDLTRDRFILSKGHACSGLYAVLGLKDFFELKELDSFAQNDSKFMAHASHKVSGVELSTGSLGHGLPFGVGKALAAKKGNASWYTYVLLSDGEMQEGSNWEAIMFAGHHKFNNLVAIIDYNNLQSLASVDYTLRIQPLKEKFEAFAWHVIEVDGHDHDDLYRAFEEAKLVVNKPICVIAKTTKGKGVSFMENSVQWHYKSPNDSELKRALKELNSRII